MEYQAADCVVTTGHVQMVCLTVAGVGYGYSWEVTVGGQNSSVFLPLFAGHEVDERFRGTSYAAPIVSYFDTDSSVEPTPLDVNNYETEGNQWVLIHGLNLGADAADIDSVEYQIPGSSKPFVVNPIRCTIPTPHRLLRCPTVQGAGHNLEWKIVIARQRSRNPVTGYRKPVITAITGAAVHSLSTDGGQWVQITGQGFGPVEGSQAGAPFVRHIRYGRSGTEYEAKEFTVLDHDTISMKTVPGIGQNLRVIVSVASQESPLSDATLSYAMPSITSVSPDVVPTTSAVPTTVTITGSNFGLLDTSAEVSVIFGNEADGTRVPGYITPTSKIPSWDNPQSVAAHAFGSPHVITFTLPVGMGPGRAVHVAVSPRSVPDEVAVSEPAFVSYRPPAIDFVEVAALRPDDASDSEIAALKLNVPVTELRKLSIRGVDFGPPVSASGVDSVKREVYVMETDKNLAQVSPYSTAPVYIANWDHTVIVVYTQVPYGYLKVATTTSNYTGRNNEYTAFDAAAVEAHAVVQESNARSYVDFSPSISALSGASGKLFSTNGGELLELTLQHLSSTRVLSVSVNNKTCPLVWLNPASGQYEDVAPADIKAKLIDGDSGVEITSWSVKCRMPAGQGANQFVVVTRDGQRSGGSSCEESGACIDYRRPTVSTVVVFDKDDNPTYFNSPADEITIAPTTGGRMQINGLNFGLCPQVMLHNLNFPSGVITFCGPDATPGATRSHEVFSLGATVVHVRSCVALTVWLLPAAVGVPDSRW